MLSRYRRVIGRKVGKGINDGNEEVGIKDGAGGRSVVSVEDTKNGPGVWGGGRRLRRCDLLIAG